MLKGKWDSSEKKEYQISYGTLCVDSSFLNKIHLKDSVFKDVSELSLHFINKEVKFTSLKLDFCD